MLRTDGRTHTRTHAHTDNVKTVYPPQTKFAGGIKTCYQTDGLENIYNFTLKNFVYLNL